MGTATESLWCHSNMMTLERERRFASVLFQGASNGSFYFRALRKCPVKAVQIAEIFESIQGEGPWAGTQSLFIRTSGCNLRCWFCDTPYTSWKPEGTAFSLDELSWRVADCAAPDVVLTGGEPMLLPDLVPLAQRCRELGKRITIETAGTVDQPVVCDLMAISPKLSNSVPTIQRGMIVTNRPDCVRK